MKMQHKALMFTAKYLYILIQIRKLQIYMQLSIIKILIVVLYCTYNPKMLM